MCLEAISYKCTEVVEAGEAGQLEVAGAQVRVELKDHLQQSIALARYQNHGHSVRMTLYSIIYA